MIPSQKPVYLASKSPRRKDMLKMMGISFTILDINLDEKIIKSHSPVNNVKRLAKEKCDLALRKVGDGIILAADTIVVLDKNIIGKPKSKADAKNILSMLSGRKHSVYTGFAVVNKIEEKSILDYSKTDVYFRVLSQLEIENYVSTGSPMDKAGAYGIQDDYGAVFVSKINGCYYNVIGFPVSKIYNALMNVI